MIFQKVIKREEEQAVASWVNYLNQVRLDRLMYALQQQDGNLAAALNTLNQTLNHIDKEIISRNRGGIKGMHGFIAEVAECGVGNAREQVIGKMPIYQWINDNGPIDLNRSGTEIQQKFVNGGNHLSLKAVHDHLEKYPWFLDNGRKYQIPKDHYEKIQYLMSVSKEQANKMPTSNGEFSLKQWKEVHEFFEKGDVKLSDIEPSRLTYKEVQKNQIHNTIRTEKKSIKETDKEIRKEAYDNSNPTLEQGIQVTVASAALEGGMTLISAIIKKRKSGKAINGFTTDDWIEITKETGLGTLKGGVRGITIYSLTNYTATPAEVASSLCTAAFGVANEAHRYRTGQITEEEFLMNSEILCVDVSVSALSSAIGQAVIPVPVLGAVTGNTIGTIVYEIAKDNLSKKEQKLIKEYLKELDELDKKLDSQFGIYLDKLQVELQRYYRLLERAFSPNYEIAFQGSIELAMSMGVSETQILKNEIDQYFS
ncbi:MAG: hypothetical protein Q4B26_05775, partial [Eubacteriales bacterium]|nr:hypothetical protein [Eubacteriales bacterium]